MGWLSTHLEEFVRPQLGFIPSKVDFFTTEELTVIKNIWRSSKVAAASRPMLLAGRDAFVFEILARRENFPTTFRPDISRATVSIVKEDYSNYYLLDTGFMGSIARGLFISHYGLASAERGISAKYQTFPHLKGARSLALKIEATPKYWMTGKYIDTSVNLFNPTREILPQEFSSKPEFERAAGITIQVYTNSSRKFVNRRGPITTNRWQSYGDEL